MKKKESSALRGLAIMLIMLHNYCHWLPFAVQENEFSFSVEKYIQFWNVISWETLFIHFFSFWGHLGVSVFVFLSGYGLVKKYDTTNIDWKIFTLQHYKKLCVPMVSGFIAYFIVLFIIHYHTNQDISAIIPIKRFLAQISLIINFLPDPHRLIMPGPYWYFGLTMQLYLIYLLFVYKRSLLYITIMAVCFFIISMFLEYDPQLLISIKYNFPGWLFPFVYGILMGRKDFNPSTGLSCFAVVITSFLIPLFGYSFYTWQLLPLLVTILLTNFIRILPTCIINILDVLGKKSLYIFVLHPITRELTIQIGKNGNPYIGLTMYIILTLILVWGIEKVASPRNSS